MRFLLAVACLAACGSPANASGTYLRDVTGDGIVDRIVVTDERDGFRTTFAYADIYISDGDGPPITAKLKDGRWIWVDAAQFPGLAALPVR